MYFLSDSEILQDREADSQADRGEMGDERHSFMLGTEHMSPPLVFNWPIVSLPILKSIVCVHKEM